jgi:DNA-binding transcriptional LysR family regulator
MRDVSWDDLKLFLALIEAGTFRGAALRLSMSAGTLSRRIDALERAVGSPLVERRPGGLVLTQKGKSVIASVRPMREAADEVMRASAPIEGPVTVRITATNSMTSFLVAHVHELIADAPNARLSFLPSRSVLSLARREADVALRMRTPPEEGAYLVRKIGVSRVALYAETRLAASGPVATLPYIGLDRPAATSAQKPALMAWAGERKPIIRIDDTAQRLAVARLGVGVALLPVALARSHPELVEVDGLPAHLDEDVYLVIHEDTAINPPIRAVADAIAALFRRNRDLFAGHSSGSKG